MALEDDVKKVERLVTLLEYSTIQANMQAQLDSIGEHLDRLASRFYTILGLFLAALAVYTAVLSQNIGSTFSLGLFIIILGLFAIMIVQLIQLLIYKQKKNTDAVKKIASQNLKFAQDVHKGKILELTDLN